MLVRPPTLASDDATTKLAKQQATALDIRNAYATAKTLHPSTMPSTAGRRRKQIRQSTNNQRPSGPSSNTRSNASANTRSKARQGFVATSHSANLATAGIFASPSPSPLASPSDLPLPAHAFWHSANAVIDPITGASFEYPQLMLGPDGEAWIQGAANEIGRLCSGVLPDMPSGTETMHFIHHTELPPDKTATYLRIVVAEKPHKTETKRVRFTCGGNRIE